MAIFEIGHYRGDVAGEFQMWTERQKLDQRFAFAHYHDLWLRGEVFRLNPALTDWPCQLTEDVPRMSVETAYKVGSKVVDEIVSRWDVYRDRVLGKP